MQITNNSPSAGYIAWTGVTVKYRDVSYSIADGNSNKLYLWWDFSSPTVLQESDTMPALEDTDSIIFINDSGTYTLVGIRSRQVHGDVILAGTVPDTALEETYVKTTTAQNIGGVKTFTDYPILPSDNPTTDLQAATKKYVDDNIATVDQASEISIADAGGYYTGTDVEAALQEIGAGTTLDTRYLKLTGGTLSGSLLVYDPTNDGNPQLRIGSKDADEGHIQAVYDSGAQTLDYLLISTDSAGEGDIVLNPKTGSNVGVGIISPSYKFSIGSADASDQIGIYHDNTNAYIKWDDGYLNLVTDEGTNTNTEVRIKGKGTGAGKLKVYDQDDAEWFVVEAWNGGGNFYVDGTTPTGLSFQHPANCSISMFSSAAEGETQELKIYGYRTGDALRSLQIGVGVDADDTVSFDGLGTYLFSAGELLLDNNRGYQIKDSGGTARNVVKVAADDYTYIRSASNGIRFATVGAVVKGVMLENGNFGIGIDNPSGLLHIAKGGAVASVYLDTYSSTGNDNSTLYFRKSISDTIGTKVETVNDEDLAGIAFQGVNSSSAFVTAASIISEQRGASGASYVPAEIRFRTSDGVSAVADRLVIREDGKIGIGVTSPLATLDVVGTARFGDSTTNYASFDGDGDLTFTGTANLLYFTGAGAMEMRSDGSWTFEIDYNNNQSDRKINFGSNGSTDNLMVIKESGEIGIGTATPSELLHLFTSGTTEMLIEGDNADIGIRIFDTGNQNWSIKSDFSNTRALTFANSDDPSSAPVMVMTATTHLTGLGTITPLAKLHIDQSIVNAAIPVLTLAQADVDEDFFKFIGTSDTNVDRSLVDAADFTTPGSIVGWLKINIQDDQGTNPITDGDYYIPFYTAPSA